MKFYDSVKSSIREEAEDEDTDKPDKGDGHENGDSMPFDELKKGAQDAQEEPETGEDTSPNRAGDDTEIEVLTENGLEKESSRSSAEAGSTTTQQEQSHGHNADSGPKEQSHSSPQRTEPQSGTRPAQQRQKEQQPGNTGDAQAGGPTSGAEEQVEVLRRIEQQNKEMIELMKGIKRSLER